MHILLKIWLKLSLVLLGIMTIPQYSWGADQTLDSPSFEIKIVHQVVPTMEEAIQTICQTWGGKGVVVAFDFDDTLFSKETELENGQTIRYLEKSTFTDLAVNGGVHPIFKAATDALGLNLIETGQSFRSIRRHFLTHAPELPLNVKEERYYSVEEYEGIERLRQSIKVLKSEGVQMCIVSAAGGEVSPLKVKCACNLGFDKEDFLRGYKKFEQVLTFLDAKTEHVDSNSPDEQTQKEPAHKKGKGKDKDKSHRSQELPRQNPSFPIHTLILIDDTQSYIDAWHKQALATDWDRHPWIKPSPETEAITVVGMHYDFLGQHPEFVSQKMIEEFLALYGEGYRSHPLMQPFLDTKEGSSQQDEGTSKGCFFPFLHKWG